jgi:hypothetical protein
MKKTILLIPVLVFAGCGEKKTEAKYARMIQAEWLLGNWENTTPEGVLAETWEKENDSVFKGASLFIKKEDTLHVEAMSLYQSSGSVYYSSTVLGQNGDKPVAYRMTSGAAGKIVFENPAHEFPRRIGYNSVTPDSIVLQISGVRQGKPLSQTYGLSARK